MTIRIADFDTPSALEDKRLKELTGCPIHKAIDSVCTEPGCPNNGRLLQIPDDARFKGCPQVPEDGAQAESDRAPEIYKTEPKQRCIL